MRGEIYNEGEYGAKSTFTAILGREACYCGKVIKWDELLAKGRDLAPGIDNYTLDTPPPTLPDENGNVSGPGSRQVQPVCLNASDHCQKSSVFVSQARGPKTFFICL